MLQKIVTLLFTLLIADQLYAGERGLQPEDYYHFQFVENPQISPDGEQILFTRTKIGEDKRSRETNIWLASTSGEFEPRAFTSGTGDRHPRWSPDGKKIAFLSDRDEETKIWSIPIDGGEAEPLFESEHGISGFEWSPDGKRLLLSLSVDLDEEENDNGEPEADVEMISTSLYKSRTRILPQERTHLWVYDIGEETKQQLTWGEDWNARSPSFSPDGSKVAYQANKEHGDYEGSYNADLFIIPADSGSVSQLTDTDERSTSPVWSPDGETIAFNHTEARYQKNWLYLIDADGSDKRKASEELDLIPSNVQWDHEGEHLFFEANHHGGAGLFRLSLDEDLIEPVIQDEYSVGSVAFSEDGETLAFVKEDETRLAEVWSASHSEFDPQRVSGLNDEILDTLALNPLETFWFENRAGTQSQGFLLKPIDWEEGESYPLVLNIKGGPGGMWGHQWFHEIQMMAANGYGVFFTNYRGSHGYGFDHQKEVFQDYGGADYEDNMDGLEMALQQYEWIDEDQLFVTGGSHGGFLTNWITAHQGDRFRAAVTQRSVSNWISEAGTQMYEPQMMRDEFGGTIWENYDLYWGRSPLKYADQVETPTRIIHSDSDQITPIGQGEEWYYALKINEVPVDMAVFEGEGHGLSRAGTPVNLVKRLELILEWFEKYRD